MDRNDNFFSLFDYFIDIVNGTNLYPNSIRRSRNLYREVYDITNLDFSNRYSNQNDNDNIEYENLENDENLDEDDVPYDVNYNLTRNISNLNRIVNNYTEYPHYGLRRNTFPNIERPIENTSSNILSTINQLMQFGDMFTNPDNIINTFQEFLLERDLQDAEDVKVVLTKEQFDNLKKINTSDEIIKNYNKSCYICIEDFLNTQDNTQDTTQDTQEIKIDDCNTKEISKNVLVLTQCKHLFHENCIKTWLTEQSSKCPVCRTDCRDTCS